MEGASNKRIYRLVWILLVAGLFSCCGGLTLFGDYPTNGIHVDELETDLNARLPIDSTWEQAEEWFASHGFQTYGIGNTDNPRVGLGATVPNNSLLETAEIHIDLFFSPEGLLTERSIYRFIYSF